MNEIEEIEARLKVMRESLSKCAVDQTRYYSEKQQEDIAYLLAEVKRLKQAAADLDMVYRRMVAVSQPDRYAFPDCD